MTLEDNLQCEKHGLLSGEGELRNLDKLELPISAGSHRKSLH